MRRYAGLRRVCYHMKCLKKDEWCLWFEVLKSKGSQNLRFNEKHPSLRGLICLQYICNLAQDCGNSVANALALLPSCTEPSLCNINKYQRGLYYHSYDQNNVNGMNDIWLHYTDVIIGGIASQLTSLMIVYSTVYSDADQRKHHSSVSLAFVSGIHRGPVNSPHEWPVTRKMFPFDDVIMGVLWGHCGPGNRCASWLDLAPHVLTKQFCPKASWAPLQLKPVGWVFRLSPSRSQWSM